jgi:hypothetical protein
VLLRSIIVEREPIQRQAEMVQGFAGRLFGFKESELDHLSDDRIGRALDQLFDADRAALLTDVVASVGQRFGVRFEEFHNDSTSIRFCGQYHEAVRRRIRGRRAPAITYGYSKDHRPDLKQLLFILSMDADDNVPVHFRCAGGNASDSRTHIDTWNALRAVAGKADFLYVADSKLCSHENMDYIDRAAGRGRPGSQTVYRKIARPALRSRVDRRRGHRRVRPQERRDVPADHERPQPIASSRSAHKGQPMIEKRFEQIETVHEIAPVFLKNEGRIEAMFTVYLLALLVQALIERELRHAKKASQDRGHSVLPGATVVRTTNHRTDSTPLQPHHTEPITPRRTYDASLRSRAHRIAERDPYPTLRSPAGLPAAHVSENVASYCAPDVRNVSRDQPR